MDDCDVLFLVGTDFPYRDWYPTGKTVVQLDARQAHIGRRTSVGHALVGDVGDTLRVLLPRLDARTDTGHLDAATEKYAAWHGRQQALLDPGHDTTLVGRVRAVFDNPDDRIRPEAVAASLDRHAAPDAVFTTDTGMSTVWVSRFVTMSDRRRLLGSYNLGSMANALPQALGAQALDRDRQVIACAGDGGLMMLLGDLRTAVTYRLPICVVVFDNGRLGMVKLEQEQGGLPEFGTELDNPDFAAVAVALGLDARRVTEPDQLEDAVAWALAAEGPTLSTSSPTPRRSPYLPSRPWPRAGASRSPSPRRPWSRAETRIVSRPEGSPRGVPADESVCRRPRSAGRRPGRPARRPWPARRRGTRRAGGPRRAWCPAAGLSQRASYALPTSKSPTVSANPSASAPAAVARCSRCPAVRRWPSRPSSCWVKYACRPSLNSEKPVPAPTSDPSATRTPNARCAPSGNIPLPSAALLVGQCATAAPLAPSIRSSPWVGCTLCASTERGPSSPCLA